MATIEDPVFITVIIHIGKKLVVATSHALDGMVVAGKHLVTLNHLVVGYVEELIVIAGGQAQAHSTAQRCT
jgi:hypothetical protein